MSLLEKTFDRTLDAWTHAYMAPAWRGAEPQVCTTVTRCTRLPAATQLRACCNTSRSKAFIGFSHRKGLVDEGAPARPMCSLY